jgi:hypothetical protein
MEIVIGLIILVIVGVALYFAVKNKGALELFSDVPYKTEAPKIVIEEDDDITVYPPLKAIASTKPIISPEKGKMGKPKLVKVEGGPNKSKTKPVPVNAKPNVAQGKTQGTKNKTTAPIPKTTTTSPSTNKKRKPKV